MSAWTASLASTVRAASIRFFGLAWCARLPVILYFFVSFLRNFFQPPVKVPGRDAGYSDGSGRRGEQNGRLPCCRSTADQSGLPVLVEDVEIVHDQDRDPGCVLKTITEHNEVGPACLFHRASPEPVRSPGEGERKADFHGKGDEPVADFRERLPFLDRPLPVGKLRNAIHDFR